MGYYSCKCQEVFEILLCTVCYEFRTHEGLNTITTCEFQVITSFIKLRRAHVLKEKETTTTACVGVNEGHFKINDLTFYFNPSREAWD